MKLFYLILGVFITFMVIMFVRVGEGTDLTEVVNNTEKIQITFYSETQGEKFVEITDRDVIRKFDAYISSKDTPVYQCGYNGKIVFFLFTDVAPPGKNTIVVEFNLDPDCQHAAYFYANSLQTKSLTEEGLQYLNNLQH